LASDDPFRIFVADQLAVVGCVSLRAMFGGAGVYLDGRMFGLIAFDTLYFKADDVNRPDFEAEGMAPFSYETKGGRNTIMSYWQVPERLYEDADEMRLWARKAIEAAHRSGTKRAKSERTAGKSGARRVNR
jgi:DNA transformation protein